MDRSPPFVDALVRVRRVVNSTNELRLDVAVRDSGMGREVTARIDPGCLCSYAMLRRGLLRHCGSFLSLVEFDRAPAKRQQELWADLAAFVSRDEEAGQ